MSNFRRLRSLKAKAQKGFTIIELMIVISIVGILSAIALPAMSNYLDRAKATAVIQFLGVCKTAADEIIRTSGSYPANANADEICSADDSVDVAEVTWTDTRGITLKLTDTGDLPKEFNDALLVMTPRNAAGDVPAAASARDTVSWECGVKPGVATTSTAEIFKLFPANCRNTPPA